MATQASTLMQRNGNTLDTVLLHTSADLVGYARATDAEVSNTAAALDALYQRSANIEQGQTETENRLDALESGKSDVGHTHAASDIASGTLSVERGGTGNADGTVAKLTTPRKISLTGYVTGSVDFDGSEDVSMETTHAGPLVSVSASRTDVLAAGANYTVPAYIVGSNRLMLYLDGLLCVLGASGSYQEVGTSGTSSTSIQFNQDIPADMEIKAVVL